MARRASRAGGRSTRGAAARTTSSRKPRAAAAAAEPKQDGLDLEGAIGIATAVLLVAAMLVLDYHMGTHYSGGFFFK